MHLHQSKGSKDARECPFHQAPGKRMGSLQSMGLSSARWRMGCATAVLPCSMLHQTVSRVAQS